MRGEFDQNIQVTQWTYHQELFNTPARLIDRLTKPIEALKAFYEKHCMKQHVPLCTGRHRHRPVPSRGETDGKSPPCDRHHNQTQRRSLLLPHPQHPTRRHIMHPDHHR
jgi:hypothetical protein